MASIISDIILAVVGDRPTSRIVAVNGADLRDHFVAIERTAAETLVSHLVALGAIRQEVARKTGAHRPRFIRCDASYRQGMADAYERIAGLLHKLYDDDQVAAHAMRDTVPPQPETGIDDDGIPF